MLGVGNAYRAILHILNSRNCKSLSPPISPTDRAHALPGDNIQQFAGAVGFIDGDQTLHTVSEHFMVDFAKTYYRRSLLHVAPKHYVWDPERRRPSKKFGRLAQARNDGLARMAWDHRHDVQRFILQRSGLAPDDQTSALPGALGDHGRRTSARVRGGNGDLLSASLMGGAGSEVLVDRFYREPPAAMVVDPVDDSF